MGLFSLATGRANFARDLSKETGDFWKRGFVIVRCFFKKEEMKCFGTLPRPGSPG